jgi:hypothetical protein
MLLSDFYRVEECRFINTSDEGYSISFSSNYSKGKEIVTV